MLHSRPPFWINMHLNGKVSLGDKHGEGKKGGSAMGCGAESGRDAGWVAQQSGSAANLPIELAQRFPEKPHTSTFPSLVVKDDC